MLTIDNLLAIYPYLKRDRVPAFFLGMAKEAPCTSPSRS